MYGKVSNMLSPPIYNCKKYCGNMAKKDKKQTISERKHITQMQE